MIFIEKHGQRLPQGSHTECQPVRYTPCLTQSVTSAVHNEQFN